MKKICLIISVLFFQFSFAQFDKVSITGVILEKESEAVIPYANVSFTNLQTQAKGGSITNENGRFILENLAPGNYELSLSLLGFVDKTLTIQVGKLTEIIDIGKIFLETDEEILSEVVVEGKTDDVLNTLEKKVFSAAENISQAGGSVLQLMQNLPGITVTQDDKIELRGSDRVVVLIDGQQTALTGFGNQKGLENIPASAIEKIEIINNPSAKYDAQGMSGIINIIMKKESQKGWNGKVGLIGGMGAFTNRRDNIVSDIPDPYLFNPIVNPSVSLNYRTEKVNYFFQGDFMDFKRLNKNEFIQRRFDNGDVINQQFLENRTQTAYTIKTGVDWYVNEKNTFSFSGLFGRESHIDRGYLPYLDASSGERIRQWNYWEDEINTAASFSSLYTRKFEQPGKQLQIGFNYSFQREDETFLFDNIQMGVIGDDATFLIADENVADLTLDFIKPHKQGRTEVGAKLRWRYIPTNMEFVPGQNSILNPADAGWADYNELINAVYGTYILEKNKWEVEAGLRVEYVKLDYDVIPNHSTYASDGFTYFEPFPNLRFSYNHSENQKFSLFYNRRVDRPDEPDLRIFPKYDDPEILKVGNPSLLPQFSQNVEIGSKTSWVNGYLYAAIYGREIRDILTRIITSSPSSNMLNAISQNAGTGRNLGLELVLEQKVNAWYNFNLNGNVYYNRIDAFSLINQFPVETEFSMSAQEAYSGNLKWNHFFKIKDDFNFQLTGVYLAPDILPQGRIASRFSIDLGITKQIQQGKGELFLNGNDIFNTLRIKTSIMGEDFELDSSDFFQTQFFRLGYNYRFY